jgi:hypothetical protein
VHTPWPPGQEGVAGKRVSFASSIQPGFQQLGPIGLGNPILYSLNFLEEGGNSAIGTRKLSTGFNEGNSNIGLAKEAETKI